MARIMARLTFQCQLSGLCTGQAYRTVRRLGLDGAHATLHHGARAPPAQAGSVTTAGLVGIRLRRQPQLCPRGCTMAMGLLRCQG
jgi:hypothetical protein